MSEKILPVQQTRFGKIGNCLAACVVSLLGLPDKLDNLSDALGLGKDWTHQRILLAQWLHRYGLTCIPLLTWEDQCKEFVRGCLCIASGMSCRGLEHAVVWQDGLLHDPHPDGTGLREAPTEFTLLVPMGHSLMVRAPSKGARKGRPF